MDSSTEARIHKLVVDLDKGADRLHGDITPSVQELGKIELIAARAPGAARRPCRGL